MDISSTIEVSSVEGVWVVIVFVETVLAGSVDVVFAHFSGFREAGEGEAASLFAEGEEAVLLVAAGPFIAVVEAHAGYIRRVIVRVSTGIFYQESEMIDLISLEI